MIEYKLLTAIELNEIDPQGVQWPLDTFGIVALEDGKVVGRTTIMNLPVIEGTWIEESKRGGTLAVRLVQRIEELYKTLGKTHAMALVYNEQPEIAEYLKRFGFEEQPLRFYAKELVAKKEAA